MKLSIIIPVFNEELTISQLLQRVRTAPLPLEREIIVVNDGSTDRTAALLSTEQHITLATHTHNQGKGAAIRTGIAQSTGQYILIQDADLEYDPNDYQKIIAPLLQGTADVVYGSRFLEPRNRYRLHTYLANHLLSWLTRLVTHLPVTDMESCYKAFRSETLRALTLTENRFGIEPELTRAIARLPGIRYQEVPISYTGRSKNEGKKIRWTDGVIALWCLLR